MNRNLENKAKPRAARWLCGKVAILVSLAIVVSAPTDAEAPDQTVLPEPGGVSNSRSEAPNPDPPGPSKNQWVVHAPLDRMALPDMVGPTIVKMKAVSSAPPKRTTPFAHIQGELFQFQPDLGDETRYRGGYGADLPEQTPFPADHSTEKSGLGVGDVMASFDGLENTGSIPPDTILAVGPDHIVEATNSGFAVYSRFGTEMQAFASFGSIVSLPTPWAGYLYDPRVVWSPDHNKWVILILGLDTFNTGSFHWIMVSQAADPTGDWWIYRAGSSAALKWLDYASLGVDQWGVYVAGNQFTWSNEYDSSVLMTHNPAMMSGGSSNGYIFLDLRWPNNSQATAPQIAHPHSVSSTEKTYFVNTFSASGNQICLWEISGDRASGGSSPATLNKTAITLSTTYNKLGEFAAQPDVTDDLHAGDCRVMNAVYSQDRVWATFGTDVNNDGSSGGVITVRLNSTTGNKEWETILWYQGYYFFYPAITVLGGAASNPNVGLTLSFSHPTLYYGSLATYIYNQSAPLALPRTADGLASYVVRDTAGLNRWGDYNGAVYDWTCGHLWVAGEYAGTGNTWRTRIASYNFGGEPVCDRVEVSSPNGGEAWPVGSTRTISWQASNPPPGGEFYIYYNSNGIWYQVGGPLPSTARSWSWEVPPPITTEATIYVGMWDGSGWGSFDYSDEYFSVIQPACVPAFTLNCPWDANMGTNDGAGSTDVLEYYSCNDLTYTGNEYAYSFSTPGTSQVTVTLSSLTADLDLFVLEGSSCYPNTCVADSTMSGSTDELITFTATAGADYRIVVDGYQGASSIYAIQLSCLGAEVFSDDFENGSTSAWDSTVY